MDRERVLPEGVIDADPAGGWDGVDDLESRERNAEEADSPRLTGSESQGSPGEPDGPIESDAPTQGADPDLGTGGEQIAADSSTGTDAGSSGDEPGRTTGDER